MSASFSAVGYAMPLLHAAKYHSDTVIGVLLAPNPAAEGSSTGSTTPAQIHITDAIPLLHHYTSLSPMAEAALDLCEVEAKGRGLVLAGVYVAHASDAEVGLGRPAERILEGIRGSFPAAIGVYVSRVVIPLSARHVRTEDRETINNRQGAKTSLTPDRHQEARRRRSTIHHPPSKGNNQTCYVNAANHSGEGGRDKRHAGPDTRRGPAKGSVRL